MEPPPPIRVVTPSQQLIIKCDGMTFHLQNMNTPFESMVVVQVPE